MSDTIPRSEFEAYKVEHAKWAESVLERMDDQLHRIVSDIESEKETRCRAMTTIQKGIEEELRIVIELRTLLRGEGGLVSRIGTLEKHSEEERAFRYKAVGVLSVAATFAGAIGAEVMRWFKS